MVYSASSVVAEIRMGSSYYFALRQLIWIAIAIPLMMFFKKLDYRKLQTPAVAFTAMGMVMMLLVVVYFADPQQHRWIRFGPFGRLQPSEFAKPALALFLAYFIALRSRAINSRYTLLPAHPRARFRHDRGGGGGPRHRHRSGRAPRPSCSSWPGSKRRYIVIAGIVGADRLLRCGRGEAVPAGRVVSYVDPQFKLVDKIDTHGWIRDADEEIDHRAATPIIRPEQAEDRRGLRRSCGRRSDAGEAETVLSAGSAHGHDLRGCRRRVRPVRSIGRC